LVGSRKCGMDSWARHLKYILFCACSSNFMIVCVCNFFVVSEFIYYCVVIICSYIRKLVARLCSVRW
jgi:hypothetical protein